MITTNVAVSAHACASPLRIQNNTTTPIPIAKKSQTPVMPQQRRLRFSFKQHDDDNDNEDDCEDIDMEASEVDDMESMANNDDQVVDCKYDDSNASCASSISPLKKTTCMEVRTDKVLTFLQSARERNIPVRSGKWHPQEERYLRKLVQLFVTGVLDDVAQKASMRAWLSKMLNCCPMRISKKQMHGEKFIGKAKFHRDIDRIERMTQEEYDSTYDEVCQLRSDFLKHWAKDEFIRRNVRSRAMSFDEWYTKVLVTIPKPKLAKNDRLIDVKRRPQPESLAKLRQQLRSAQKKTPSIDTTRPTIIETRSVKKLRPTCFFDDIETSIHPFSNTVSQTPCTKMSYDIANTSSSQPCHNQFWASPEQLHPPAMTYKNPYFSEDTIQVSLRMTGDLQCMDPYTPTKSDELLIDFGPPSMWNFDMMKDMTPPDCSQWSDEDLLNDLELLSEPGLLLWDEVPTEGAWRYSTPPALRL